MLVIPTPLVEIIIIIIIIITTTIF